MDGAMIQQEVQNADKNLVLKWQKGRFLKRYKRFFADCVLNDEVIVAHVPNTGSLLTVQSAEQECLLSPSTNPERKLKFTLEALRAQSGAWVGVNTSTPNKIVMSYLQDIYSDSQVQSEFKINSATRLDFAVLKNSRIHAYIEVKSVTMARPTSGTHSGEGLQAQFPDAVTERGRKHLDELVALISNDVESWIYFVVQRNDCQLFDVASDIDPDYALTLKAAIKAGLKIKVLECVVSADGVKFTGREIPLAENLK
jgi:sugar fermentation stimulation protein A